MRHLHTPLISDQLLIASSAIRTDISEGDSVDHNSDLSLVAIYVIVV